MLELASKISFRNKIDTICPALHLEFNRSYYGENEVSPLPVKKMPASHDTK